MGEKLSWAEGAQSNMTTGHSTAWSRDQPSYSGGGTYCRCPAAAVEELHEGQIAVVGAPLDEGCSTRPGTRYGPRAIRYADDGSGAPQGRRHLDSEVRPFELLDVVDLGDLPVIAGHPEHNLELVERTVSAVAESGAVPILLGGDHSIARASVGGAAGVLGPLHVVQLDAHTDTGEPGPARPAWSHGAPMRRLVDERIVEGRALQQVGLRGWWPGDDEIRWAREQGVRWWTADDVRAHGLDSVLDEVIANVPADAGLWLSFDIDVVDPAFAPGTGTPEPGGLTSWEALRAVRRLAAERRLSGFELVEVSPPYDPTGITALLAHRLVLAVLTGVALARSQRR
jgi:agmatinase